MGRESAAFLVPPFLLARFHGFACAESDRDGPRIQTEAGVIKAFVR